MKTIFPVLLYLQNKVLLLVMYVCVCCVRTCMCVFKHASISLCMYIIIYTGSHWDRQEHSGRAKAVPGLRGRDQLHRLGERGHKRQNHRQRSLHNELLRFVQEVRQGPVYLCAGTRGMGPQGIRL